MRFTKGSKSLKYKTNFDEIDYTELDFLQKKFKNQLKKPEILNERGILTSKKNTILTVLGPSMPRNRLEFWHKLVESNTALDLVIDHDTNPENEDTAIII